MVLAVPIKDYDEAQDNKEEEEIFKINGAIHEEINTEARERRRSGLKEDNKLPPIRARNALEKEEILKVAEKEDEDDEEENTNSEVDLSSSLQPETDNSETTETEQNEENMVDEVKEETKEEKKEGKLSKFFSGFRKKKSDDLNESQEGEETDKIDQSTTILENKTTTAKLGSNELINEELDKVEKDLEETPSPDKVKKKVSFFRQFSKESKDEKVTGSQESLGSGMKGFRNAINKKPPPVPEGEEKSDSPKENGENNSLDDESDSELEDSSPVKVKNPVENEEITSTPVQVDTNQPKATTKIKSKSCSIL